ncbi:MAG TPA: hypothetical protein PKH95_02070 [Candidatus Magasanikbacteria bacterium]|nr:hypothetical protein [Candidatus Magasanikbacteria bacterium]
MSKIILLVSFVSCLAVSVVFAQGGLEEAGSISGLVSTSISQQKTIPGAIGLILGQATIYLGIIFFLLIVYAGFLWMSASGAEAKVEKAKGILIAAVTGLVIVLSAYAIVNFVFGNVLNVAATKGCTTAAQQADFAECQPSNMDCIYQGTQGDYVTGKCEGGTNIKCCVVKLKK